MALSALPTELLHAISGHLGLQDRLGLCRTNSHMHSICIQWIYRVVAIKDPAQLLLCCKTIIARPEAALSVWQLKIDCFPGYALKSFYTTLRFAATKMENLQVITMASPHLFCTIADMVFPRLTDCNIPLSLDSADSYSFLHRNPTIERVFIIPVPDQSIPNNFDQIQSIHMPRLRHFVGPEIAACALGPNPSMGYSHGLSAASSSTAELCALTTMIASWDIALPAVIAKHTPRIQVLNIWGPTISDLGSKKEDFLSAMDDFLPSLTCLVDLIVSDKTSYNRISEALESEFDRVRRWGDACPTPEAY
ncbi:hypothetical protein MSAN_00213600 [Mycena sanguinolenta]|uniref:F-box domain-containing protein n=1 Tax=Mycena sanguinolenta TaxID=230812 RepID=A0A8H6ZID0_9AGAR|nr:hypothetical protein MSAN_00213600 [Mycena sanguinolenta]